MQRRYDDGNVERCFFRFTHFLYLFDALYNIQKHPGPFSLRKSEVDQVKFIQFLQHI